MNEQVLIEDLLKNSEDSATTIIDICKQTHLSEKSVKEVLKQLSYENKIVLGSKGVTWIVNDSPVLAQAVKMGREL